MPEASSRVLLDRTVLRLDGRPFFTLGAELRDTAASELPAVLRELSDAGFNTVGSPPLEERNAWYAQALLDEAEKHGHLVIAQAAPGQPAPAAFLAKRCKHRVCLHSYRLAAPPDNAALQEHALQRDHLRTMDLFHPIWAPRGAGADLARWAAAMDLHSVAQVPGGPAPRSEGEDARRLLLQVEAACREHALAPRPLFCHALQCGRPGADPASLAAGAPEADLLRIRAWELLAARARGIVADSVQDLRPPSGRDRLAELAVLAREATILLDFLAEGQLVHSEVDTGHPRLQASLLHHGDDVLVLLWRSATGDEYWIDDSVCDRLEVRLKVPEAEGLGAWRLDFPGVRRLSIGRQYKGAATIPAGRVDLTAAILLTRGTQRADAMAAAVEQALPAATRWSLEGVRARMEKAARVEGELSHLSTAHAPQAALEAAWQLLDKAAALHDKGADADAWKALEAAKRRLRSLVDQRMTEALASGRVERDSDVDLLRRSYHTLPLFHREVASRLRTRVALDYT